MAGPTPVSALIHAATMVTAGVYMVARCNVFYRISHEWALKTLGENATVWGLLTHDASFVVAVVGGATALFAATMGLAQTDIKKVLAYSTVSQLGYMFLGCGALAFSAGMFHVFTHAWFKACLFLGAGSVIHALGGEQDMTKMGGPPRSSIPHTFVTMFVATLAIAGVPGLAGFFSKDAILAETWGAGLQGPLGPRGPHGGDHGLLHVPAHPDDVLRDVPRDARAAPARPRVARLHDGPALGPRRGRARRRLVRRFRSSSSGRRTPSRRSWSRSSRRSRPAGSRAARDRPRDRVAPDGHVGRRRLPRDLPRRGRSTAARTRSRCPSAIAASLGGFYRLVRDKYRVDELYEAVFVNGLIKKGGRLLWEIDARVVDLIPNGATGLTIGLSNVSSWFDRTFVDGAVNGVGNTLQAAWRGMRRVQTGRTQNYALTMAAGVFGFVCLYLLLRVKDGE